MAQQVFIGNLAFKATEDDLRELFDQAGFQIISAKITLNHDTGKSRGFGFVKLPDGTDLDRVIGDLNGTALKGRPIDVQKAKGGDPSEKRKAAVN